MATDDSSVFDEMSDEAWDHLNGVPVTASILRELHARAKQITFAKPARQFDTLSNMAQQTGRRKQAADPMDSNANANSSANANGKPPRPKRTAQRTRPPQRQQQQQQRETKPKSDAVKVVTGAVSIPDRYSRVCVENEDGEEIEY